MTSGPILLLRSQKLNLDSKIAKIATEVIFELLDLMHVEGVETQTLVLVSTQLNHAIPQIGYRDPFPFVQSIFFVTSIFLIWNWSP